MNRLKFLEKKVDRYKPLSERQQLYLIKKDVLAILKKSVEQLGLLWDKPQLSLLKIGNNESLEILKKCSFLCDEAQFSILEYIRSGTDDCVKRELLSILKKPTRLCEKVQISILDYIRFGSDDCMKRELLSILKRHLSNGYVLSDGALLKIDSMSNKEEICSTLEINKCLNVSCPYNECL